MQILRESRCNEIERVFSEAAIQFIVHLYVTEFRCFIPEESFLSCGKGDWLTDTVDTDFGWSGHGSSRVTHEEGWFGIVVCSLTDRSPPWFPVVSVGVRCPRVYQVHCSNFGAGVQGTQGVSNSHATKGGKCFLVFVFLSCHFFCLKRCEKSLFLVFCGRFLETEGASPEKGLL